MKVTVDQDKCVSSGQCVVAAAGVFDQRDETAWSSCSIPSAGGEADGVRHAAAVCPALAINIEE